MLFIDNFFLIRNYINVSHSSWFVAHVIKTDP